jgi:hypothetical protein
LGHPNYKIPQLVISSNIQYSFGIIFITILVAKEKAEKLTKLKEDINVTQKNLVDMQEQVRQLERLYQDYDSLNTSEGQVNPAALYREIMKPQSVPYVNFCKPPTQVS